MFLENLINKLDNEERKKYLTSLSDSDKTILFQEIEQKKKEVETETIKLETTKKKLEEDEAAQMEKLKAMGITSYEQLELEINKLETTINSEIIKYAEALKGE